MLLFVSNRRKSAFLLIKGKRSDGLTSGGETSCDRISIQMGAPALHINTNILSCRDSQQTYFRGMGKVKTEWCCCCDGGFAVLPGGKLETAR